MSPAWWAAKPFSKTSRVVWDNSKSSVRCAHEIAAVGRPRWQVMRRFGIAIACAGVKVTCEPEHIRVRNILGASEKNGMFMFCVLMVGCSLNQMQKQPHCKSSIIGFSFWGIQSLARFVRPGMCKVSYASLYIYIYVLNSHNMFVCV